MTDDLVKRLRDPFYTPSLKSHAEAADRIEQLEAQLAQSQFIRWAARFEEQSDRIDKLERALEKIAVHHRYNEEMASIARKALEGKND